MKPVIFIRSFGVRFANSVVRFKIALFSSAVAVAEAAAAAVAEAMAGLTFARPMLYF